VPGAIRSTAAFWFLRPPAARVGEVPDHVLDRLVTLGRIERPLVLPVVQGVIELLALVALHREFGRPTLSQAGHRFLQDRMLFLDGAKPLSLRADDLLDLALALSPRCALALILDSARLPILQPLDLGDIVVGIAGVEVGIWLRLFRRLG